MASPRTPGMSAFFTKTQEADFRRIIKECIVEANRSLQEQITKVELKTTKNEKGMKDLQDKMAAIELDVAQNKSKVTLVQEKQEQQERHLISFLWERSQKALRLQNIEEDEGEIVGDLVSRLLSPLAEMPEANFASEVKAVYRVATRYTQMQGLPREICVKLRSEETRGKILYNANRNLLEYQGKTFKILKDVPQLVRAKRAPFKNLARMLLEKGVNYRWLVPQGLGFTYKSEVVKITSEKHQNSFLEKYKADFAKEEASGSVPKPEEKKKKTPKEIIPQKRDLRPRNK